MLVGTLNNLAPLAALGGNFETAARFLQGLDISSLEPKDYEIDGEQVFAMFCEVDLRPYDEAKPEAHRRYADIQLVLDGCEGMLYAPIDSLTVATPYSEEADVAFYENPAEPSMLALKAGEFAVFMPWDAHTPNSTVGAHAHSKKLLMKVKL